MVEVCLHIHNLRHIAPLIQKFRPFEGRFERYIVSVPVEAVADADHRIKALDLSVPHTVIGVENRYNDWSGYLALLRHAKSNELLFCNDSVISRRIMLRRDFQRHFDLLISAKKPSLIGELDTAKVSVSINGHASASWVSSYLFGLKLGDTSAPQVAAMLESTCETISEHTRTFFLDYLGVRRKNLLKDDPTGGGKLYAMHLERLMTDYAVQNDFDIVSVFGGDWNRKVRKLAECVKSA